MHIFSVRLCSLFITLASLTAAELPDLTYAGDVGKIIGRMDRHNGLLPADGRFTLGAVQVTFHKGYMIAPATRNAAARGNGSTRGAFAVFDISDPRNPQRTFFRQDNQTNNLREQHGVLLFRHNDRDIYVANAIKGIQTWDVTNPTQPQLLSDYRAPSTSGGGGTYQATGWWVGGAYPYVYLGVPEKGFISIDVSDPANPQEVQLHSKNDFTMRSVGSVHTVGNLMVLGNAGGGNDQFATVDLSDPLNPQLLDRVVGVGDYSVGLYGHFVTMGGGSGDNELQAWDISDPGNVRLVRSKSVQHWALYSAFQDKFFHGPMFYTYHKQHFDYTGTPSFNDAGVMTTPGPIAKTYEFISVMGNLVIGTGGGNGDGIKIVPHQVDRDRTPPQVNYVSPAAGSVNQALTSRVGVIVTDTLDFTTVNEATFTVAPVGGQPIAGTFSYSRNYLNFFPAQALADNTTYEVRLVSGGITDLTGNGMVEHVSYFSTGPEVIISSEPSITITSPVPGATTASTVSLSFAVRNWMEDGQHLHYSVDSGPEQMHMSTQAIELSGLSAGSHTVTLALVDANHAKIGVSDSVTFTVDPLASNAAPLASATVNAATVDVGSTIYLDASGSSDPDDGPNPLSYTWSQVAGPTVIITSANQANASVVLSTAGSYTFEVIVSDGHRSAKTSLAVIASVPGQDALLVASSTNLNGGETALRNRLQSQGWTVDTVSGGGVTASQAEGYDLVLVSSSVNSGNVNNKLRTVAVPVMVWESFLFDAPDIGLVGSASSDYGYTSANQIEMATSANALTAGLSGSVTIATSAIDLARGNPGANAIVGARLPGGDAVLFGYETGAAMPGGIDAPARRVAIFLNDNTFTALNAQGLTLFDNAVSWAANLGAGSAPLQLVTTSLSPIAVGSAATLTAVSSGGLGTVEYSWEFTEPDGSSSQTPWSTSPSYSRTFATIWNHQVILRARDDEGTRTRSMIQEVYAPAAATAPVQASTLVVDSANDQVVVVNPDNDSVTFVSLSTYQVLAEVAVAAEPRSIALDPAGDLWVTSAKQPTLTIIDAASRSINATIAMPYGSEPSGVVAHPAGGAVYVALSAAGEILRLRPSDRQITGSVALASTPRRLAIAPAGNSLYVGHFISPDDAGKVSCIDLETLSLAGVIDLRISDRTDTISSGAGLPNYLGWMAISPDGARLLVPSKQDNTGRGLFRDGRANDPENVIRNIVSTIDLTSDNELYDTRFDINDSEGANGVAFSPRGNIAFVSLRGNNAIAIMDVPQGSEIHRLTTGAAPVGVVVLQDDRLLVHNYLDRTLQVINVSALLDWSGTEVATIATVDLVANESLTELALAGKILFYNAGDRMSANAYMSCASCHLAGDSDGRTWDFTDRGEGLRNTIDLRGKAGAGHGNMHWTANFDEVQDFENDIRNHFGGLGFMSDTDFAVTSATLGPSKTGLSADLDALAAYVSSLDDYPASPHRQGDGSMTDAALAGEAIFKRLDCASCHSGPTFTNSTLATATLHDVGTLNAGSGSRLGETLTGLDTPSLRSIWASPPYFHDGSAATLAEVINRSGPAHGAMASLAASEKAELIAYLEQLDGQNTNPGRPSIGQAPSITLIAADPSPVTGINGSIDFSASDPDGGALTYAWTVQGPATVTFSSATVAEPTLTFTAIGTYTFTVVVTDDEGDTATAATTVTVVPTASKIVITP